MSSSSRYLLFLGFGLIFGGSKYVHSQGVVLETAPTTCASRCDGQLFLKIQGSHRDKRYHWKPEKGGNYVPLDGTHLSDLCVGSYRLRQTKTRYDIALPSLVRDEAAKGFYTIGSYTLDTRGRVEVSLQMRMNMSVNHLNYYINARYSADGGETWKNSNQIHQLQGSNTSDAYTYQFDLPRSADSQPEILVDIQRRLPSEEEAVPDLNIMEMIIFSKSYEEYVFQIESGTSIKIQGTVSDVVDDEKGYINLILEGGIPPYRAVWSNGEEAMTLEGLTPGKYGVKVSDATGCNAEAIFQIDDRNAKSDAGFSLDASSEEGTEYLLRIWNIWRKPIELLFLDSLGEEAHRFRVNPLYEDLEIPVDLGHLSAGDYTVIATSDELEFRHNLSIR